MATGTGVVYRDLLPLDEETGQPDPHIVEAAQNLTEEPTASHALAQASPEFKGSAQIAHDADVKDLGWNEPPSNIPAPLVGGIDNEELWVLVRRFNKVSQLYRQSCLEDRH
jgi:hypothetical protein